MPRRSTALLAVAALALHGLLLLLHYWPATRKPVGDEPVYLAAAQAAARGDEPNLEMLWPPAYPRFLAFFGARPERLWWPAQLAQLGLLIAAALMLRRLTIRLSADPAAGRLAGDLVAAFTVAFPPLAAFAQYFWPEVLHLALWIGMLWLLADREARAPGGSVPAPWRDGLASLAFGAALGYALLAKSVLQPFAPLLLLAWGCVVVRGGRPATARPAAGRWLRGVAAVLLAAATVYAVLAPTLRHHQELHGVRAVANSGAINLWIGLNDTARRDRVEPIIRTEMRRYRDSSPRAAERHSWAAGQIRDRIAERGLPSILAAQLGRQYFRLFDKDSFFTDQLPGGVLYQRGRGYVGMPAALAVALRWGSWALYALLLVAIAQGLAYLRPAGRVWVWTILAYLGYSLALFLLVHIKSRYRVQLLPVLFPFAGTAVASWIGRLRGQASGTEAPPERWRKGLATALSILLLFLAFGGPFLDG